MKAVINNRIKIIFYLYLFLNLLLISKLFYWQVIRRDYLTKAAQDQYEGIKTENAPRGEILAKDGSWLAATVHTYLVYADPKKLNKDPGDVARTLAPFFLETPDLDKLSVSDFRKITDEEENRLLKLLSKKDSVWVPLKQTVPLETKEKISALKLTGINFEEKTSRYYPEGSSAAHLIGFVGKDDRGTDKGYFGLEGNYDITLTGKKGYLSQESDLIGNPFLIKESKVSPAISGITLLTSVDKVIQHIVDSKLPAGIEKYGALAGNAIVMDPKTGAVLAMSSFPGFEQSKYWEYKTENFINPNVSLSFEPGSIFKVVVMASGLDAGVIDPDTICDKCSTALSIGKYSIRTWDDKYHPNSTMKDVIIHSDNVGMAFVAGKLGKSKLYDYIKSFGFGDKTGIDLQGELSPPLRKKAEWGEIETATASFGQGIAVTPIQMVRAVSAIANKGVLLKPYVVDSLIGDGWEEKIKRDAGKRIISEKAAGEMTDIMAAAARFGESKWTYKKGYKVAGKTGTAQIPIAGHYDADKTIASYIGFAPYDDPKFVLMVTLDRPTASTWASETAAPLWYSIAGELFDYFGMRAESGV